MKVMTASEASRAFSAVLDEAEHGETIVVTRAGRRVAMITPVALGSWGALREAVADWQAADDPTLGDELRRVRDTAQLDEDAWTNA